ncbi:hypothetical protein T07_11817 [Trichinella nelsoni]|uniref:Uncharacterized protein n=1 Tax=Trichinella nelsoni TaxID=6336 RepID=A0A0V0SA06_9BILA|nr:hypothetical protein T07_11817 [Trichinella nelsoni]
MKLSEQSQLASQPAISKVILQCHTCCCGAAAAAAIDMMCSKLSLLDFSSTPCDHIAKVRTKRLSVISSAVHLYLSLLLLQQLTTRSPKDYVSSLELFTSKKYCENSDQRIENYY